MKLLSRLSPLTERGWLSEQDREFQSWLAEAGRWREFVEGEPVYEMGDPPDGLYGLGAGALEVSLPLVADEPVTLYRAEIGFWIGESAILAHAPRMIGLTAVRPSRLFFVPAAALRRGLHEDPSRWEPLYALSHANTSVAVNLLAESLALSPRARLARLLLRLGAESGRVQARQDELARVIGMTRSSFQRSLRSLVESGVVSSGYGEILLLDIARLERLSTDC